MSSRQGVSHENKDVEGIGLESIPGDRKRTCTSRKLSGTSKQNNFSIRNTSNLEYRALRFILFSDTREPASRDAEVVFPVVANVSCLD